jgi:5-methylcytosine-specific restriction endonuclease McrA
MTGKRRRRPPSKVVGTQHTRNRVYGRAFQRAAKEVLARAGYRCQIGGPTCSGRATLADHIVPWQEGGAWTDPANLRAACRSCNAYVAAHPEWRPGSEPHPGEKWPRPSFGNSCPHQAADGSWCVGHPGHWTQWYIKPPKGKGDGIA